MKALKSVYKRYKGVTLRYTLYRHFGKYVIAASKRLTREEKSVVLRESCTQAGAEYIFECVCESNVTPCALKDIIDDITM